MAVDTSGDENHSGGEDQRVEQAAEQARGLAYRVGQWVGVFLLLPIFLGVVLVLPVAIGWAVFESYPSGVVERPDAGFADRLLSSVAVLWAVRIVVVGAAVVLCFAAIYFVASIVVRTFKGQWLRKAGPFEPDIEQAEEALDEGLEMMDSSLTEAWEREEDLERRLEESNEALENFNAHVEEAWAAREHQFEQEREAMQREIDELRSGEAT